MNSLQAHLISLGRPALVAFVARLAQLLDCAPSHAGAIRFQAANLGAKA